MQVSARKLFEKNAESRRIRVTGLVQGVGFRPFVWRLAQEMAINGWVRNDANGVEIEAEAQVEALLKFIHCIQFDAPAIARVDHVHTETTVTTVKKPGFYIVPSAEGEVGGLVMPDVGVCTSCLEELFNPKDRRYRYPFINCTQCGPRYTLTKQLPYDRCNTAMAKFDMCPACDAGYHARSDRRFHAELIACKDCGPKLWLADQSGATIATEKPFAVVLSRLLAGDIVAVKGVGGFHLMCDARNPAAVAKLRERKHRDHKPFAVMFANVASIAPFADVKDQVEALESPERPIVLLPKRPMTNSAFNGVAPGMSALGVMLPYTPIQMMLFHEAAGLPAGTAWLDDPQPLVFVCTSGNDSGEPLAITNEDALHQLAGIADLFLLHNRDIEISCDDSVIQGNSMIRRARGYTPQNIRLAQEGPGVLALGGFFKSTVCLTRGNEAFVSQHIGDLDHASSCELLDRTAQHLQHLLKISPDVIAHDLHPDFFSTRLAHVLADRWQLPVIGVQHHHAHIASVCAEHQITAPVLGLALDGVGLGLDGQSWGGELLYVNGNRFLRLGHLQTLALPGGDRAAREPWRMAASALHALGRGDEIHLRYPHIPQSAMVAGMLDRHMNSPMTSSMGRLFDAAAGLLHVMDVQTFEGQAAMRLEALAEQYGAIGAVVDGYSITVDNVLEFSGLLDILANCKSPAMGAAMFHATLATGLADWIIKAAAKHQLDIVACGGGCFMNQILIRNIKNALHAEGLKVLFAEQVPSNDGGLSLGQAWVAMQH